MKRFLCLLMTAVLLLSMVAVSFHAAEVDTADEGAEVDTAELGAAKVPNEVYANQRESQTCTLAAAANMIRARFYLSENDSWKNITESSIYSTAWVNGMGLRGSFTYTYDGNSVSVGMTNVSGISVATLKSLVNSHPEGVEIYSRGSTMHAVLVTDYEGDTFYCSDSDWGRTSDRIPLTSSLLGNYGSQANILSNIGAYWVITSYSINPTNRRVDLGDDFYGLILHQSSGKPIGRDKDETDSNSNIILTSESRTTYSRTLWHFIRRDNLSYTITIPECCNPGKSNTLQNNGAGGQVVCAAPRDWEEERWYLTPNESGYYLCAENSTSKVMDLTGANTDDGTSIQWYSKNTSDAQRFTVFKLNANRDKLNYSITASKTTLSQKNEITTITVAGATPYVANYKFYVVHPDGHEVEYDSGCNPQFEYYFTDSLSNGNYSIYAKVTNPFYTDIGTSLDKNVYINAQLPQTTFNEGDFTYTLLDDGTVQIDGYNGDKVDIIIPAKIEGYDVSVVSTKFNQSVNKESIKRITVSEGIKELHYCFMGFHSLEEVILPKSLAVWTEPFAGCTNLTKVEIPKNLTYIGLGVFYGCTSLDHMTIPNGVTSIDIYAFAECSSLKWIEIPESVTSIGNRAFSNVPNDMIIYGVPGSYAETYANQNRFTFIDVNNKPISTEPPTEPVKPTQPVEPTQPVDPTEPLDPDAPYFAVSDVKAMAGDEVSVTLSVNNNPGITALSVQLSYPEELTLTSVDYTTPFSSKSTGSNKLQSPFTVSWYSPSSANEDDDGVFATLKFKVADGAKVGSYPITLTYDADNVFDSAFNNVAFGVKNGTLAVHDHVAGDINGDGKVNMKDVVLLQQKINGWDVDVNDSFADVNGDTKVNMKDIVLLQQSINGWEVELK